MASKCIVIILVAVCALQVANSSEITEVLEAINTVINKTNTAIKDEISNFYNTAGNLSSNIGSQIIAGASSAASSVASSISEAEELGANITTCVSAAESGINSTVSDAEAGIESCLSNSSATLDPDMETIDTDVELAENLTSQAVSNYSSCGVLDLICRGKVLALAQTQGATLAAQVAEHAASIDLDLASATSAFDICSAEVSSTGISSATAIYEQEGLCIEEKISEVTSS